MVTYILSLHKYTIHIISLISHTETLFLCRYCLLRAFEIEFLESATLLQISIFEHYEVIYTSKRMTR